MSSTGSHCVSHGMVYRLGRGFGLLGENCTCGIAVTNLAWLRDSLEIWNIWNSTLVLSGPRERKGVFENVAFGPEKRLGSFWIVTGSLYFSLKSLLF